TYSSGGACDFTKRRRNHGKLGENGKKQEIERRAGTRCRKKSPIFLHERYMPEPCYEHARPATPAACCFRSAICRLWFAVAGKKGRPNMDPIVFRTTTATATAAAKSEPSAAASAAKS